MGSSEVFVQRPRRAWKRWALALLVLLAGLVGTAWALREQIPPLWEQRARLLLQGIEADDSIRITMPDGTRLAASLYRPRGADGPLPTILVREPYGRLHHGEALRSASLAKFGYAVLAQDLRGKFDSEGQFATWEMATDDGVATLDWIVKQPWSNGKVGTYGCSALGEVQYSLARARPPAHKVMIAYLWKLTRPRGLAGFFWRLLPNPYRRANATEVGHLLAFFGRLQTISRVQYRFHPDASHRLTGSS